MKLTYIFFYRKLFIDKRNGQPDVKMWALLFFNCFFDERMHLFYRNNENNLKNIIDRNIGTEIMTDGWSAITIF